MENQNNTTAQAEETKEQAPAIVETTPTPPIQEPIVKAKKHSGHVFSETCKCGRCINIRKGKVNNAVRDAELKKKYFAEFEKELHDQDKIIFDIHDVTQKSFSQKHSQLLKIAALQFPNEDLKNPYTLVNCIANIAICQLCKTI